VGLKALFFPFFFSPPFQHFLIFIYLSIPEKSIDNGMEGGICRQTLKKFEKKKIKRRKKSLLYTRGEG